MPRYKQNPCEDCKGHSVACEKHCQKKALSDVNHPGHKLAVFFEKENKRQAEIDKKQQAIIDKILSEEKAREDKKKAERKAKEEYRRTHRGVRGRPKMCSEEELREKNRERNRQYYHDNLEKERARGKAYREKKREEKELKAVKKRGAAKK